jgi:protein subunit release factor A
MTRFPAERVAAIEARKEELQAAMSAPDLAPDTFVQLSKDYAEILPVAEAARELRRLRAEIEVLDEMLADPSQGIREMAQEELAHLEAQLPQAERDLALKLLPRDAADERAAMLEIRAGTGGDEAALFAGDLLRMYQRYAEGRGWRFEIISASPSEVGGYKEVIASVAGSGVFARLKFESGVHRVQRVPVTESGGRIHTSAATVAVLPEAEDVDVQIDDKDLRIDVRPRRPIGQHHRQRRPDHPPAHRPRRHPAGREVAAQEQGQGIEGAAHPPLRARARAARLGAGRRAQVDGRLGRPLGADPHLQFPAGAGHRPPHQSDPPPPARNPRRPVGRADRRAERRGRGRAPGEPR